MWQEKIHNDRELEFAVFCIENVALELQIPAEKVYQALTYTSDLLNQYIIPEYEMLHTQSKEYIVADIIETIREWGIKI